MEQTLLDLPMLSATQVKMFKDCPLLYWHIYKDSREQIPHIAALLGSALHKAIELRARDNKNPAVTFSQEFDRMVDESPDLRNIGNYRTLKITGFDILGKIEWTRLSPRSPEDIEKRFLLPFPTAEFPIAMFSGIIDMITDDGKTIDVIDHKSSGRLPADLDNDLQFVIYLWAFEQMEGTLPDNIYWHHLRTGEFIKFRGNYKEKLSDLIDIVNKMIFATKTGIYPKKVRRDSFCARICAFDKECWPV